MMDIHIIPILNDNYCYLLTSGDWTAVVDPGAAAPVEQALNSMNRGLDAILITHHHGDHVEGVKPLLARYSATVAGPRAEQAKIGTIDMGLADGDHYDFNGHMARIIETPGHTAGHIAFWFEAEKALFCGDTLFSLGCGRIFEGTAEQMWTSLQKLAALPDDTRIYCGHEYTEANGRFALTIEPDNTALLNRMDEVHTLRAANQPTLPALMGMEKQTNPFLRAGSAERFAEIRRMKDLS